MMRNDADESVLDSSASMACGRLQPDMPEAASLSMPPPDAIKTSPIPAALDPEATDVPAEAVAGGLVLKSAMLAVTVSSRRRAARACLIGGAELKKFACCT